MNGEPKNLMPFRGTCKLLLELLPWKLALPTEGLEISKDQFICRIPKKLLPEEMTMLEVNELISGHYPMSLQLHFTEEDLPITIRPLSLHSSLHDAAGLIVNLNLDGRTAELDDFLRGYSG